MSEKTCKKCGITKQDHCYRKHSASKDGLATVCKECKSKEDAKYYQLNKERIKIKALAWRKKNPEHAKEWQQRNPERCLESHKKWRQSNPIAYAEYQVRNRYRFKEPELVTAKALNILIKREIRSRT